MRGGSGIPGRGGASTLMLHYRHRYHQSNSRGRLPRVEVAAKAHPFKFLAATTPMLQSEAPCCILSNWPDKLRKHCLLDSCAGWGEGSYRTSKVPASSLLSSAKSRKSKPHIVQGSMYGSA